MKLLKIASILEIEIKQQNTLDQPKILSTTTYSQYQLGKDFNLTIVRNCPAK
jgi:hypothetical protein